MDSHSAQALAPDAFRRQLAALLGARRRNQFIPNQGNAGDALINAAAWQLLHEIGVAGRVVGRHAEGDCDAYVYSGGGNLIPRYDGARRAIEERMARDFDVFVILPHTIRGHEDLLARFDTRFHVFCRDVASLHHVGAHTAGPRVHLADDLALALDLRWLQSPRRRAARFGALLSRPGRLRQYLLWRRRIRALRPRDGELRILRCDAESAGHGAADPRLDLSACCRSLFDVPGEAELIAGDFVRVLQRAERVTTDRLHVAIGASLLGLDVRMLDNDYGKNRGIYELSMRRRFPNTRFDDATPRRPTTTQEIALDGRPA